jgi:hypothetical protein
MHWPKRSRPSSSRQERRAERIAHDEENAALERRAIAAELQLTELRAANDHRGSSDPIAVDPLAERRNSPETDPLDVVLDGKLDKTSVQTFQEYLNLPPFRGPVARAHAVRAQYFMAMTTSANSGGTVSVPPTFSEKDRKWWDNQAGKTARQINMGEDAAEAEDGQEVKPFRPST